MTRRLFSLLGYLYLCACGAASVSPEMPAPPRSRASEATLERSDRFHALLPTPVTSFGAAVVDGRLYVAGGYHGTPHRYTSAGQSGEVWSVSLEAGDDWRQHADLGANQGLALVAHDGSICAIGGMRVEGEAMISIDAVRCLDTRDAHATWIDRPPLPSPRSTHDAFVVGDTVYVFGGWALNGDAQSGRFATTVASLDLSRPDARWVESDAPFRRRALAVAGNARWLAVIGGLGEDGHPTSEVEIFDLATRTFTHGPALPEDGFGVAASADSEGVVASAREGTLHRLDAEGTAWTRAGSLMFPRFFHRLVPHPEGTVAVGGIRGMSAGARVSHVELVAPSAAPSFVTFDLPNAGAAKNRQGAFLLEGALHLFGGNDSLGQHDFELANFESAHHVLSLDSLTWRDAAPYPFARQTVSVVLTPDGVNAIALGGFGHDGTTAHTHPEGFLYEAEEDHWEARAGLPVSRSQFGLVEHEGTLYVFGGLDYDPSRSGGAAPSTAGDDAFRHLTEVLSGPADGSAPLERVDTPMPEARRAFGGAELHGTYYLVGGMHGEFELVTSCRAVELSAMVWREIACPRFPRLNPQLVAVGERLYLVGGTAQHPTEGGGTELGPEASIEVYEPTTNTWSTLVEAIPLEPRHLRAFAHRGRLVLFSTHDERPLAHVAVLTLPE
jgi:hypothetical protein